MIVGEQIDHAEFKQRCRRMTDDQLRFVLRDCRNTLAAWNDHPNEGKYLDQMNYASDELNRRNKK